MLPVPCRDSTPVWVGTPLPWGGRLGVTIFIAPGAEAVKRHAGEMAQVRRTRTDLRRVSVVFATSPIFVLELQGEANAVYLRLQEDDHSLLVYAAW